MRKFTLKEIERLPGKLTEEETMLVAEMVWNELTDEQQSDFIHEHET
jgi:hypothetical protein